MQKNNKMKINNEIYVNVIEYNSEGNPLIFI